MNLFKKKTTDLEKILCIPFQGRYKIVGIINNEIYEAERSYTNENIRFKIGVLVSKNEFKRLGIKVEDK